MTPRSPQVAAVSSTIPTSGQPFSVFELTSDYAGVLISSAYGAACLGAVVVLWGKGGRGRLASLVPAAGIAIVIAVLYFSLFPLPSGWELVAPVAGVTTILVMTVVALVLSRKAGEGTATSDARGA